MPALTLETQEDGSVLVAPATQPLDPNAAEKFASLDEAMTAVTQVLGTDEAGPGEPGKGQNALPEEAEEARGEAPPTGDSLEPTAPGAMEEDMQAGYNRARKGQ